MANRNAQPSGRAEITPSIGRVTVPNQGERSIEEDEVDLPSYSLGVRPVQGNRAGGGQEIDVGARVGIMLNREFAAGGRAQRLITGTYDTARPSLDPRSGEIHTSSAGGDEVSLGRADDEQQPPTSPQTPGSPQSAAADTSSGPSTPARQRDKQTP